MALGPTTPFFLALVVSSSAFNVVPARTLHPALRVDLPSVHMDLTDKPRKQSLISRIFRLIVNEPDWESEGIKAILPFRGSMKATWPGSDEPVSTFMSTSVVTLSPDMPLSEAGRIMTEQHITGAPVVDENDAVVGVLSRIDLLYKVAGTGSLKGIQEGGARSERYMENTRRLRKLEAETVGRAMTPYPVSLSPDASMQQAAALMLRRNLNRVLITEPESSKLIGIISSTDVFRLAFDDSSSWRARGESEAGL